MLKAVSITLLILILLVVGWHFAFPLMGGIIAITGMVWAAIVTSIIVFCALILLLFVFTGLGIFLLGLFGFIWVIIAIALFPLLFPILIPLFIILMALTLIRRSNLKKQKEYAKLQHLQD